MNANSNCRTLWLVWKVLSFKKFLFVQWVWSHSLFGNIKLQFIFLQVFESKFIEVDIVTRYICTANFQLSVLIWYFKMTFKLDLLKFLYSGLFYAMTNTKNILVTFVEFVHQNVVSIQLKNYLSYKRNYGKCSRCIELHIIVESQTRITNISPRGKILYCII